LNGSMPDSGKMSIAPGTIHHVELQVLDLSAAIHSFGWLFSKLGYEEYQAWDDGRSWIRASTYIVVARAPRDGAHDRRAAGLSHLAFHAGTPADVDALWAAAPAFGWKHLYAKRHPWAGGGGHYAAFVESGERFKVELIATLD
jgi:catechol-2,3-dioxygenase